MLATQTRRPEFSSLNSWKCWLHVAACLSFPELWLRKWRQEVPGQAGCSDQPSQEILRSDGRPCLRKAKPDQGRLLKSALGFCVPVCAHAHVHTQTHMHVHACISHTHMPKAGKRKNLSVLYSISSTRVLIETINYRANDII